ncbi:MAG: signal recognition particle-docking protein FtsY, partial [Nocardioides sp.]
MGDLLYLIIGIAVIGALLVVGLLARTRSGRSVPPAGGTDVIATPVETAPAEAPVETATAPVLEKPEGTASRLQR